MWVKAESAVENYRNVKQIYLLKNILFPYHVPGTMLELERKKPLIKGQLHALSFNWAHAIAPVHASYSLEKLFRNVEYVCV